MWRFHCLNSCLTNISPIQRNTDLQRKNCLFLSFSPWFWVITSGNPPSNAVPHFPCLIGRLRDKDLFFAKLVVAVTGAIAATVYPSSPVATLTSQMDLWCHSVLSPSKLLGDSVTWPPALSTQFDTQCQRIPGNWRVFLSPCQHSLIKTDHRTPDKKRWASVDNLEENQWCWNLWVYIWRLCKFTLVLCFFFFFKSCFFSSLEVCYSMLIDILFLNKQVSPWSPEVGTVSAEP